MDRLNIKLKTYSFEILVVLISFLYLFLRLVYLDTIEFGYDQPRLSTVVVDFIENGSYLTSQQFSLESPWGNLSWGPVLVYLLAPVFILTKNPIVASVVMVAINLLTILLVIKIGKDFFSKKVGLVAGMVLATHPWWVIFSRMIYQPTLVPLLILISLYCLFQAISSKNNIWAVLLFLSFGLLIQTYLITFSYIITALLIVFFYKKDVFSFKNIISGIILNIFLFIPSVYFYINQPELFLRFFEAKNKFYTSFIETGKQFVNFYSGSGFEWQLGYGFSDFRNKIMSFDFIQYLFVLFFLVNFVLSIYFSIRNRNKYSVSLVLLMVCPLWAIPFIGVEYVVPRYFLYSLPFFTLILGQNSERFKSVLVSLLIVCTLWIYLVFNYYIFIEKYNYENGFLSHYSDVPYSFLEDSFNWIKNDAKFKGYESFTISSDTRYPTEQRLNWAQSYYIDNILKTNNKGSSQAHYLMYFSPLSPLSPTYKRFGPYIVSEFKN